MFKTSQASDVGSIPIARSRTHDDSIVLTPLNPLNTAIKLGVLVPWWSQPNELVPMCLSKKLDADGRRHQLDAALTSIIWIRPLWTSTWQIGKETSVIPVPQAQNSHPCEVRINKPVPSPEALPVGGGRWNSREGDTAQIGEGQDFLGDTQMSAAIDFGKVKCAWGGTKPRMAHRPFFLLAPLFFLCAFCQLSAKKFRAWIA